MSAIERRATPPHPKASKWAERETRDNDTTTHHTTETRLRVCARISSFIFLVLVASGRTHVRASFFLPSLLLPVKVFRRRQRRPREGAKRTKCSAYSGKRQQRPTAPCAHCNTVRCKIITLIWFYRSKFDLNTNSPPAEREAGVTR